MQGLAPKHEVLIIRGGVLIKHVIRADKSAIEAKLDRAYPDKSYQVLLLENLDKKKKNV